MNRFQRIADMIADEIDAEAGPKTGPVQKAVPVAVGVSAKTGEKMNKALVAKELLAIARELVAIEFPTEEAMDKYLKDHPGADKSNHKVVPNTDKPHTDRGWNQMVRNVRPKMVKNITKMIDDAKDDAGKKKLQDALADARGGISDKDRRNIVDEAKKKGVNIEYRPFGWD